MKRQIIVMSFLGFVLFFGSMSWTSCKAKKDATTATTPSPQKAETPPFILALKEKIKGKENLPAEEVFENIKILRGMPAGRVIPIMQMAFSKSLGVKCTHCHIGGNWGSDMKPQKEIAREMWIMTGKINQELLPKIGGLKSETPVANCTTCHRGKVKPDTSM